MNTMTRDARRTPTTFEEAARRSYVTDEERSSTPVIDYRPFIIADADTGHGGDPRVRNLVRRFVEVGVPGYHIEDQRPGTKKCGHQGGKVLVAQDEQIKRLNAARFQLDVMGVPGIIVARTDAEAATLLDRRSDERDQPFLLGATNVGLPSYKICTLALMKRLDEAVSEPVNGHIPDKMLAYNLSLSFNWDTTGMTDDEMGRFPEELGKMGFVFNFMTYVTRDTDRLANVVFATVVDRKGWRILSVRDQNTFDESLRQKRLMTLVHVWLIHRYRAQSVHYVSPTDDNRYTWSFKWGITELSDSQMHGMSDDIWIGGFIFNFIKRVRHHGGEK